MGGRLVKVRHSCSQTTVFYFHTSKYTINWREARSARGPNRDFLAYLLSWCSCPVPGEKRARDEPFSAMRGDIYKKTNVAVEKDGRELRGGEEGVERGGGGEGGNPFGTPCIATKQTTNAIFSSVYF